MKKITIAQFNQLKEISPIVESNDKNNKKEIKFALLSGLQDALGDSWHNYKENTKQALQYACMRSTEQGFFFFKPEHLKEKYNVGYSTFYGITKKLIEAKKLVRVNRTSTKQNGKGSAVYIFVEHPNFPTICGLLGIEWKANEKTDCKAENAETPTLPTVSSDSQAPTYSLPSNLNSFKDNVKPLNVIEPSEDDSITLLKRRIEEAEKNLSKQEYEQKAPKFIKYVPKAINEKYGYFGDILVDIWRKIKLAERKVNNEQMNDTLKIEIACNVIDNLQKSARFKIMSVDEMCAYVYKAHLNAMFNYLAELNVREAMFIDTDYDYYAYLDKSEDHILTNSEKEPDNRSRFEWWQQEVFGNQDMPF